MILRTSDEKQILQFIGGHLVMSALKKFPMHQRLLNHFKSGCIHEESNLNKMPEKN